MKTEGNVFLSSFKILLDIFFISENEDKDETASDVEETENRGQTF